MKRIKLRKLSETLEKLMAAQDLSAKDLAEKAGMSYSSLTPILNGSRECGISKLLDIADALNCTPDDLLSGLFNAEEGDNTHIKVTETVKPKYLAVFISIVKITYCSIYEIDSENSCSAVLHFPLLCGESADEFLEHILSSILKLTKGFEKSVNSKEVAVFASVQQYGRATNRKKIQTKGDHLFAKFVLESDAITNHQAFFNSENGICISINDGDVITYSVDENNTIHRLHGYGFPISDVAGNKWLGCEAIKHTIKVQEKVENSSLLSDRLLAVFNGDLDFLSESTMTNPDLAYSTASSLVKELMYRKQKSFEIVQKSAALLLKDINEIIDPQSQALLPIVLTGELAYLYESFFPQERLVKTENKHSDILISYGINQLRNILKIGS